MTITILAHWDDEAAGWWAESPDLPGLVTEAATIEALMERVKAVLPDLLAANGTAYDEIPIELIADLHDRIRLPA
jgi:predicted RNase H-like HicB family nuclease